MAATLVDVATTSDGTLVVQPHGALGADDAVDLRITLVHAVRTIRPLRLVLDLHDVAALDPINAGTLAATCRLGDDHQVAVFVHAATPALARQLTAAGLPHDRLRWPVATP
ncbi:STAS domain-containing protein [Symbioplanes lichenis]|uniref:STAS domain-containing protein n=1 Tax=Symbioplanes lichenis TaxID=1629072 RepID=UPI00273971CA|nr:STAS domain-containing protein [Actinoplanes lichenis]